MTKCFVYCTYILITLMFRSHVGSVYISFSGRCQYFTSRKILANSDFRQKIPPEKLQLIQIPTRRIPANSISLRKILQSKLPQSIFPSLQIPPRKNDKMLRMLYVYVYYINVQITCRFCIHISFRGQMPMFYQYRVQFAFLGNKCNQVLLLF